MAPAPESGEPVRIEDAEDAFVALHPVDAGSIPGVLQKIQQETPQHDSLNATPWNDNTARVESALTLSSDVVISNFSAAKPEIQLH